MDNSTSSNLINVKALLESITKECIEQSDSYRPAKLSVSNSYKILKEGSHDLKIDMLQEILKQFGSDKTVFLKKTVNIRTVRPVFKNILSVFFRDKKLKFLHHDLERVVGIVSSFSKVHFWEFPFNVFIKRIQEEHKAQPFSETFIENLSRLNRLPENGLLKKEEQTFNAMIEKMIADQIGHGMSILNEDTLGQGVHNFLNDIPDAELENWKFLCEEFAQIYSGTKLKKTSIDFAHLLIKEIGKNQVVAAFTIWVKLATQIYKDGLRNEEPSVLSPLNRAFLRNIVLMASQLNEKPLTDAVGDLGLVCLKKVRNYGQIDKKIGNACIMTFSLLPFNVGIEKLTQYRSKIKYASTLKIIENRITDVSRKEGKTPDEIEEMGVPSMGLNEAHRLRIPMDDFHAVVAIESIKMVNLVFEKPDGKIQKTAPAALKEKFGDHIKVLKKSTKAIKETLQANKFRIENFYLKQKNGNMRIG